MSYAFLIVVSVAITLKLIFLSFSLYYTLNYIDAPEVKPANQTKRSAKSLIISWKQLPRLFLPRAFYCPEAATKNYTCQ